MPTEADLIAEKTEALLFDLQRQPASKFTLGELMWVQQLITKMRWGTSLKFEQDLFEGVSELTKRIEERVGFDGKGTSSTQAAGQSDAVAQRTSGAPE
jgi:hypothetical protein